jgi:hypothetical protein
MLRDGQRVRLNLTSCGWILSPSTLRLRMVALALLSVEFRGIRHLSDEAPLLFSSLFAVWTRSKYPRIGSLSSALTTCRKNVDLSDAARNFFIASKDLREPEPAKQATDYLTWCLANSSGVNLPAFMWFSFSSVNCGHDLNLAT